MDWTGGVRRRFAPGKNNATVQRQKAHFAKARSALQHPPSSARSFRPAFHGDSPKAALQIASYHTSRSRVDTRRASSRSRDASKDRRDEYRSDSRHDEQRKRRHNREVIHITSSSVQSSVSHQDATERARESRVESVSKPTKSGDGLVDEEQQLLMANRRRLLARSDWLGLSATRPVQMKFRSHQDKDRIGKRRRVANSASQKGRPAIRRLITPLFEDRLAHPEHLMSGALQTEDVQVRIGTDALASQTQHSRRSHTPRRHSARHPSTELGPLSEESMLLGDEGDVFEAMPMHLPGQYDLQSQPAQADEPRPEAVQQQGQEGAASDRAFGLQRNLIPVAEVAKMVDRRTGSPMPHEPLARHRASAGRESISSNNIPQPQHDDLAKISLAGGHSDHVEQPTAFSGPQHVTPADAKSEIDDETFWKRFMNFEEQIPSNPSMDAVKSSSFHITTSESSYRPVLHQPTEQNDQLYPPAATSQDSVIQIATLRPGSEHDPSRRSRCDTASPSTSLKLIRKLADQPSAAIAAGPYHASEEEAWRDFIIGSEASSTESLRDMQEQSPAQDHEPEVDVSLFEMSGLGSSIKSTMGGTQLFDGQSVYQLTHPHHRAQSQKAGSLSFGTGSQRVSPEPAHVAAVELDDIEDVPSEPPQRSRPVFPARSGLLNPRRFKTQGKQNGSAGAPFGGRGKVMKRAKTLPRIPGRSVYDLPASGDEGVSEGQRLSDS